MKPVGLIDPRNGKRPYAVVQLRQENLRADSYNIVGFQNHLRFPEQARVFRMIPGLENARFLRYGQIHRNTYINSPTLLTSTLQMKSHPNVLFAGVVLAIACRELEIGVATYLRYVVPRATLGTIPPLALLMWFRVGVDVQNLTGLIVAGVAMLGLFGLTWILFVYRDDPYVRLPRLSAAFVREPV